MRLGRKRQDGPNWPAFTHVISGELEGGSFDFTEIAPGPRVPLYNWAFDEVVARGVYFDLDAVLLDIAWSSFEDCTFRQRIRKSIDGYWPQGSFAHRPTTYRRCTFHGVRFRTRAGFSVGQARFEECIFRHCRFEEHFSFCADYVRCRFEGKVRTAVFYGESPSDQGCDGKINVISGNDFTQAELTDNIAWRGNIDFSSQKWPEGYTPIESMLDG